MPATYTKLKSGEWGVRSTAPLTSGATVTVEKRNGETKIETVGRIISQSDDVTVAEIAREDRGVRRYGGMLGPRTEYGNGCVVTDDGMQLWENA